MSDLFDIIILAFIQGLTEFLPVSSSGHLAIIGKLLGVGSESVLLSVVLHGGTLLSILIVYAHAILSLFKDPEKRHLIPMIILATIPIGIGGSLFAALGIMDVLNNSLYFPAFGLFITGTVLLLGFNMKNRKLDECKKLEELTYKDALLIGVAQLFAIMPGISRSGMTIAAGLKRKLKPEDAAEFSFLMAIPAIAGAVVVEPLSVFLKSGDLTGGVPPYMLAIGFFTAAIVGLFAVKILFISLKRGSFKGYVYYCMMLGLLALACQLFL